MITDCDNRAAWLDLQLLHFDLNSPRTIGRPFAKGLSIYQPHRHWALRSHHVAVTCDWQNRVAFASRQWRDTAEAQGQHLGRGFRPVKCVLSAWGNHGKPMGSINLHLGT